MLPSVVEQGSAGRAAPKEPVHNLLMPCCQLLMDHFGLKTILKDKDKSAKISRLVIDAHITALGCQMLVI